MRRSFAFLLTVTMAAPPAVMAQDSGEPAAGAACDSAFRELDTDGNGFLSEAEAPRDTARGMVDGIPRSAEGLSRDHYLQICTSSTWAEETPEAGAPFEGANSFTEEQARDLAVAWNITEVSPLVLDDQGIWRGTGKLNESAVAVAIDYKGNVVTTPTTE